MHTEGDAGKIQLSFKGAELMKSTHQIKIDDILYHEIENLPIFGKNSFSEKAEYIFQNYLNKKRQKNSIQNIDAKRIKFIDLFAGIGGIRLGFEEIPIIQNAFILLNGISLLKKLTKLILMSCLTEI